MQIITAKYNSKCGNSGRPVKKGDKVYYDRFQKKVFHIDTVEQKPVAMDGENKDVANYIQAQEDAYFDNLYQSQHGGY